MRLEQQQQRLGEERSADPMASFKQSTGTEFFSKRMRKDGSSSCLQRQPGSKQPAAGGAGASLPPERQRVRFGGSQQNWMQGREAESREGAQLMSRDQLRSR